MKWIRRKGGRLDKDRLLQFFESLQQAFLENRLEDVQGYISLPLVIYSVAGVTLARDSEELLRMTQQFRDALGAVGVHSTTVEIAHHEPPKNQRIRTTVTYTDFDATGALVTRSVVRYFLVERDGTYQIEMMEYLHEPLSADVVEQIVH